MRYLAIAGGLAALWCLGRADALADARSAPVTPLVTPRYTQPPFDIEVLQPLKNRAGRAGAADNSPPGVDAATAPSSPSVGTSACATDLFQKPDQPSAPALTASRELERLRATARADATVGLPKQAAARQQRLQANAAWQMGLLTLHGICVAPNAADAQAWFELARQLGEPLAPAGLAWCEIDGCRAATNPAAAGKWIEQLRGVDAPRALYLQWLLQSKLAPIELTSPNMGAAAKRNAPLQGRQLLTTAAGRGDTNAQIELGLDRVTADDLPGAIAFFNAAAAKSAAAASNSLMLAQRIKKVGPQLPTLVPAPSAGLPTGTATAMVTAPQLSAAENLARAQLYHQGVVVPANYAEAIRLYQLAQNQGSTAAKKVLALIFSRPGPGGELDVAWMQQLAQVDLTGATPTLDNRNSRANLKRDPTPLFELVPRQWRKFAVTEINA